MTVKEHFEKMDYGPAPESAGTAQAWLDQHERRFGLFINNRWVEPASGEYYTNYNPATGEKLAETAQAGEADVDAAVDAARAAFAGWSATPGHARARYLYSIARHVQKHARLLAVLETMDNGKPIRES